MKKNRALLFCALIANISGTMEKQKLIPPTKTLQKKHKKSEGQQFCCPHCPVLINGKKLFDLHVASHGKFVISPEKFKEYIETNFSNNTPELSVEEVSRLSALKLAQNQTKRVAK